MTNANEPARVLLTARETPRGLRHTGRLPITVDDLRALAAAVVDHVPFAAAPDAVRAAFAVLPEEE